jgi:hypothetical protein
MNRYKPATPRAALGLAAVAMAAITIGAMVVLPAKFDSLGADPYMLAAAKIAKSAPIDVAAGPARVDARASVRGNEVGSKRKNDEPHIPWKLFLRRG